MWMTREEISAALGIVPNSVRGKVQKGQIERKVENGKNYYRIKEIAAGRSMADPPEIPAQLAARPLPQEKKSTPNLKTVFDPRQVLLEMMASIKVARNIDSIEKGDEIDLATGEISRELDAKISMRQHRQLKEIEDALDRIRHGDYGTCEDCGEPIPEQRLKLFPAARLCVRCQEEMDNFEKMKETQGVRLGIWRDDASEPGYSRPFEE
jgi:DnaK suppressor protein